MSDWDEEESVPSQPSAYVSPVAKATTEVDDWGDDVPRFTSGPQGSRGGRGRGGGDRDDWNSGPRGRGSYRGGASSSSGNGWSDNSANDRGFRGGGRGGRGFGRGGYSAPVNDWSDEEGTKSRNFGGLGRGGGRGGFESSNSNGWDDETQQRKPGYSYSRGGRGGSNYDNSYRSNGSHEQGRGPQARSGGGNGWDNDNESSSYSGHGPQARSGGGNGWDNDNESSRYNRAAGEQRSANNGWNGRGEEQRGYSGGNRGGGGGTSYGGGNRGPMQCYNCNEVGHASRDCPDRSAGGGGQNRSFGSSGQVCFRCNESGHISRDCPSGGGRDLDRSGRGGASQDGCFKCGESGHFSRECPNGGGGGGPRRDSNQDGCFKCGESGHFSRECPNAGGDGRQQRGTVESYIPTEETEEELFHHGTSSGINFEKYEHVTGVVTGTNPPHRIETFEESGLRQILLDNVKRSGYKNPTPVQKHALPIIKEGRDLMACAQTGSGKTAAFLLPILHKLLEDGFEESCSNFMPQTPLAVVVAPTRELAIQIKDEARKFAAGSSIRCMVVYGGANVKFQASQLQRGVHVLIATPGRLLAYVDENKISFKNIRFFVLDEADRMLDLGFMPDIERLENHMSMPNKDKRQTLMFSATFPEEIQRAAANFLNNYLFLQIGKLGSACSDVKQLILPVTQYDKREKLVSILNDVEKVEKTLIFVDKKQAADFLATYLSQSEFMATSVHGDRQQSQREEAVNDFKRGKMPILVATAVAARGLDIPHVSHVINYDLPKTIDEYVHRIGRTGRVGNVGKATSFYDDKVDRNLAADLIQTLSAVEQDVPAWLEEEGRKSYPSGGGYRGGGRNHRDIRHENGHSSGSGFQAPAAIIDEDETWD